MTAENSSIVVGTGADLAKPPGGGDGTAPNFSRLVQHALRGRYGRAIVFGLILGAVAAWAGWRLTKPRYKSEGLIRIAYTLPPVMQAEAISETPVEIYEAFLQSQQALLTSQRLVDLALQEPAWQATGRGTSAGVMSKFAEKLTVEHKAGTDFLRVSYSSSDPAEAAAAVKSLTSAYQKIFSHQDNRHQVQSLEALVKKRAELADRVEMLRGKARLISEDIRFANADRLYDAAADRLEKLDSVLTDIRLARILAQGQTQTQSPAAQGIAVNDEVMRGHLAEQQRLEDELSRLRGQGYGENHALIVQAKNSLQRMTDRIDNYAQNYSGIQAGAAQMAAARDTSAFMLAGRPSSVLQKDESGVGKLYDVTKQEMLTLGMKQKEMQNLNAEIEQTVKDLTDVTQRMHAVQIESGIGGRLDVVSDGEAPIAPFRDRRLPIAAMAGLVGLLLPASLFVGRHVFSSRYRYSDETEIDMARHVPMLGILPQLPERPTDPGQAAEAAYCVHQIRVMLQVRNPGRTIYLVSSASAGDGKTSLTAALGLSFASAGLRTLLIDCDYVGRRLTHGFEAAARSGLHEALAEGNLHRHVGPTGSPRLSLLPVGGADPLDACALSASSIERLLAEARLNFDVVLIDSGPILGSVESSILAPRCDAVILVIARHQQKPLVERAVRHCLSVGAKLAGMVFNRAEPEDLHASIQSTSLRSVSSHLAIVPRSTAEVEEPSRLGPLVRCVAAYLPPLSESGPRPDTSDGRDSRTQPADSFHRAP